MKNAIIIILVVAVLGVGGWWLLRDKNTSNTTNQTNNNNTQSTSPTTSNEAVETDQVSIQDMAFTPAKITVKKGTTVTWTNNDSIPHTVTSDNGGVMDSQELQNGDTYTATFNDVGTFSYHCTIHPSMTASVTVTE